MRESKQVAEWIASEEYRSAADGTHLFAGDVMFTRLFRQTPWVIEKVLPHLTGSAQVARGQRLASDQRVARELGKRLAKVRSISYSSHWLVEEEFERRCKAAKSAPAGVENFLTRDAWSADSVIQIERRAFMVQRYVTQHPSTRKPYFVRRMSDERLLDVILWRLIVPGPSHRPDRISWFTPMTGEDFLRERDADGEWEKKWK
jgi:hypothetical protein